MEVIQVPDTGFSLEAPASSDAQIRDANVERGVREAAQHTKRAMGDIARHVVKQGFKNKRPKVDGVNMTK
jgi:hypothetical protein